MIGTILAAIAALAGHTDDMTIDACEAVEAVVCQSDDDCRGSSDPAGHPTTCEKRTGRCVSAWPMPSEVADGAARLRRVIESVCDRPPWARRRGVKMDASTCAEHAGTREACEKWCDPDRLHALLGLVALRESTFRAWKRHVLDADQAASAKAWSRRATAFGWRLKSGSTREMEPAGGAIPPNPAYPDSRRWSTGLGLLGQVPALTVDDWDAGADPEVLCRAEVAVLVYLRRMRRAMVKYASGVDCSRAPVAVARFRGGADGSGPATWVDLHRAASTGSLCPTDRDQRFVARAAAIRFRWPTPKSVASIDPHEAVPASWLGRVVSRSEQEAWANEAGGRVD